MSIHEREMRIKLDLLDSLALSQRSLARMMASVAECVEASPHLAEHVAKNLEAISRHQRILTQKITGIRIGEKRIGTPARPWMNPLPGVHTVKAPSS